MRVDINLKIGAIVCESKAFSVQARYNLPLKSLIKIMVLFGREPEKGKTFYVLRIDQNNY